jgi:predicted DCC family thiol-disulfide oxidoreductase YuxK
MIEKLVSHDKELTVFYDGACPLCNWEISFYKRQQGSGSVAWVDVAKAAEDDVFPGLSRDRALARFHVVDKSGALFSGGAAFSRLWLAFPVFRPLGVLLLIWPFSLISEWGYQLSLKFRPRLTEVFRARDRPGTKNTDQTSREVFKPNGENPSD